MEILLNTKFFIPPLRTEHVPRARLTEQLGVVTDRKLILISAPAGFGKTTLVSEWIATLGQHDNGEKQPARSIVWLSLDESDNDLSRFLNYLIVALRQTYPDIGSSALDMLQTPQPIPVEIILTTLINEITSLHHNIVLILDDYHTIHTTAIDEALTYLIEHLPGQMHLVIVTRDDPQLPLARLRARGELTELRALDLRFTLAETTEFLNQALGRPLTASDIAALDARTEGWIVGLQLAALSMQGHQDVTSLIQSFSGSHRFVLDYLIEEVLDRQPESVQTFLLQTAILNRVSASLCDAVTERHDSKTMLEMLENANLFIIALDHDREWYRYHHLFADLLRQRLHQERSDEVAMLHSRASEWYAQHGFIEQAIEHAMQAQDFERAAIMIEGIAEAEWGRDERAQLRRWLDSLPVEIKHTKLQLCIYDAWSSIANGQMNVAEQSLSAARETFAHITQAVGSDQPERLESVRAIRGKIALIQSYLAFYQQDVSAVIQYAHEALDNLPEDLPIWRSTATIALGDALVLTGDYAATYQARMDAVKVCQSIGEPFMIMVANLKLVVTLRNLGQLQQVIAICQDQLKLAQARGLSSTTLAGCFLAVWGEVLAELNQRDDALNKAESGVELMERSSEVLPLGWGYMCMARVLFSRGDFAEVEASLERLDKLDRESDVPKWLVKQVSTWQIRVWLAQDKLTQAAHWLEQHGFDEIERPILGDELEYLVYARILLAQGNTDKAINVLQKLLESAQAGGRTAKVIEIQILSSLVYQEQGDMDCAVAALEHSLGLAEQSGFIRTFVDEGPPMAQLLYAALERDIMPDYVRRLLAAFPAVKPVQSLSSRKQHPDFEFIEPLSDRELEVLLLVADGLTNPDIAARLFLSPNTVKVHTRNIYDKLDVHNRTEAVARARGLGLLSTD